MMMIPADPCQMADKGVGTLIAHLCARPPSRLDSPGLEGWTGCQFGDNGLPIALRRVSGKDGSATLHAPPEGVTLQPESVGVLAQHGESDQTMVDSMYLSRGCCPPHQGLRLWRPRDVVCLACQDQLVWHKHGKMARAEALSVEMT